MSWPRKPAKESSSLFLRLRIWEIVATCFLSLVVVRRLGCFAPQAKANFLKSSWLLKQDQVLRLLGKRYLLSLSIPTDFLCLIKQSSLSLCFFVSNTGTLLPRFPLISIRLSWDANFFSNIERLDSTSSCISDLLAISMLSAKCCNSILSVSPPRLLLNIMICTKVISFNVCQDFKSGSSLWLSNRSLWWVASSSR